MHLITDETVLHAAAKHLSARDKVLAKLIKTHGISRMQPWASDPFSSLIDAIIGQQLSVKAANTIGDRVLKIAGRGKRFVASKLLSADEDELRACGLSGAKSRYVQAVARAVIVKDIDLKKVQRMDDEQALKALTALNGVGKWTAEMLMIFAYGHADILSLGDWGLRRGAQMAYQLAEPPNDKVFIGMAEIWRPYRSVASWYLWRAAEGNAAVSSAG